MYKGIILLLTIIYCLYHAFAGSRGLLITLDLDDVILEKKQTLASLEKERKVLELKLRGLEIDTIDLDYLEELAKEKLGFADPQESVLLIGDLR